jgi:predicted DNA-binding transcriptional regulator AlpA
MIKEDPTQALRKQLANMHDDQVIGVPELAAMLDTSPGMIYRLAYVGNAKLPPRLTSFGRKLAWRLGTCREWLRALPVDGGRGGVVAPSTRPRMGRPRTQPPSNT